MASRRFWDILDTVRGDTVGFDTDDGGAVYFADEIDEAVVVEPYQVTDLIELYDEDGEYIYDEWCRDSFEDISPDDIDYELWPDGRKDTEGFLEATENFIKARRGHIVR